MHQVWPLDINEPYRKVGENKRLIFDLNLEFGRRFQRKKNEFTALLGVGISGLNTGYVQVIRQYSNATDFIDYKEDINFLFPTISAGFGWQKGKFLTQIKMGYCWNNPTWSTYPFFFPELSLQYKIKYLSYQVILLQKHFLAKKLFNICVIKIKHHEFSRQPPLYKRSRMGKPRR